MSARRLREEIVKIISGLAAISLVAASSVFRPILAEAAEIKLLCAVAMKPAVDELARAFERSAAHKLIVTYGTAGALRDKIRTGEAFDAALLPAPFMDPLVTQGAVAYGCGAVINFSRRTRGLTQTRHQYGRRVQECDVGG
jgi:molybdate transport system substrate-binding protein